MSEAGTPSARVRALAGEDQALAAAVAGRVAALELTDAVERAVLAPSAPGGLEPGQRGAIARRVARLEGDAALERDLLDRGHVAELAATRLPETRLAALPSFVDAVTATPRDVTAADVRALSSAGLSDADVVRLTGLVAFLAYRTRLVRGVAALAALMGDESIDTAGTASAARVDPAVPERGSVGAHDAFTTTVPSWRPRVAPVDPDAASPLQREALAITPSGRPVSDYVLVLAHDPEALLPRSPLFNAIMYDRGGASRAERELAATVASRVNGCVYCAAVHASRHLQLTKRDEAMSAVLAGRMDDPSLDVRERAVVRFAAALSASPARVGPADAAALREAGLEAREALDVVLATALFGWANRLMHVLGDPVPERTS